MSNYRAPSRTNCRCEVGWLRGKFEDGYWYDVRDDDGEIVSSGGMGNMPYRYDRPVTDYETNLPTIADLLADSWGHVDWATPQGRNLIRSLIDDAWKEAVPEKPYGPARDIRNVITEALYGPAGAQQQSATG